MNTNQHGDISLSELRVGDAVCFSNWVVPVWGIFEEATATLAWFACPQSTTGKHVCSAARIDAVEREGTRIWTRHGIDLPTSSRATYDQARA